MNGASGDPDGDGYPNYALAPNLGEYNQNPLFGQPAYDPLKYYGSTTPEQTARPILSISSSVSDAVLPGGAAAFTIHRAIGLGADLTQPLTAYYALSGTAVYDRDYSLSPLPSDLPRIFSAVVPAGQASVTVTLTPLAGGVSQAGLQEVVVSLVPFEVAAATSSEPIEPGDWLYVLDLFHRAVTLSLWNGLLINLEKTTPDGYLRIKPTASTAPLPFINVANSVRGTVARIYTGANLSSDPSRVAGEYFSAPAGMGRDPSRTTVDRYGNVWVGNRQEGDGHVDGHGGSITEYGVVIGGTRCDEHGSETQDGEYLKPPFIYNTCVDRHGATVTDAPDGYIHTYAAQRLPWSNSNNADSLGGVSTAEDEAILRYLRVMPTAVRTIIVDPNNNVWAGSRADGWNEFIDAVAGMQVTGWKLNFQAGGYGGVIDGYGAVWSSGSSGDETPPGLLRFLPGTAMPVTTGGMIRRTGGNYGITVDPSSGDVWQPLYTSASVMQFRADHCATTIPIGQDHNRGIVIDGRGNVWVGGTYDTIFHLTTAGAQVGAVPMSFSGISATAPLGVAIDYLGAVWAICWNDGNHGYAMRVDPALGQVPGAADRPVGEVVEVVDLGAGSGPYNYSDMSGFVTLSSTQPSGVWDHVEDGGAQDTLWNSVTTTADIPTGTRIVVEVRGANTITNLPSWPFVTVGSGGTIPSGIKGRYLEVRANLLRDFGVAQSPELRSLTVQHGSAGCSIQITTHPKSQAVAPGENVTFTVTAEVPQAATATYQWLKNGSTIPGATTATLTLNSVQDTDAARYSVRVGAVNGCTYELESAPARLHVKGNPPELSQEPAHKPIGRIGPNGDPDSGSLCGFRSRRNTAVLSMAVQ